MLVVRFQFLDATLVGGGVFPADHPCEGFHALRRDENPRVDTAEGVPGVDEAFGVLRVPGDGAVARMELCSWCEVHKTKVPFVAAWRLSSWLLSDSFAGSGRPRSTVLRDRGSTGQNRVRSVCCHGWGSRPLWSPML